MGPDKRKVYYITPEQRLAVDKLEGNLIYKVQKIMIFLNILIKNEQEKDRQRIHEESIIQNPSRRKD